MGLQSLIREQKKRGASHAINCDDTSQPVKARAKTDRGRVEGSYQ